MTMIDFELASLTIKAGITNSDNCGANGLPMTPSSIQIVGNFMAAVDSIRHCNLTEYVDCFRSKNEKVTLVFEHYSNGITLSENLISDILMGLYHLHYNMNIVHGNIVRESIVFSGKSFKLAHWCLNHVTECGSLLDSCGVLPDDVRFLSPERLKDLSLPPTKKADVWSLGLVLLTYLMSETVLPEDPSIFVNCRTSDEVLSTLKVKTLPAGYNEVIRQMLQPRIRRRANLKQVFKILNMVQPKPQRSILDTLIQFDKLDYCHNSHPKPISIKEAYYFWSLLSPKYRDTINGPNNVPPLLTMPHMTKVDGKSSSAKSKSSGPKKYTLIPKIKSLSLKLLNERLKSLDQNIFYPLILTKGHQNGLNHIEAQLPLVIREGDFEYQCQRTMLFKRLTNAVPYVKPNLVQVSKVDVSPLYRAKTWAAILNVKWSDLLVYDQIDKTTPTTTDRQISVDIPRCHQYNDLLSSPQGHRKLTRILKAWLSHNESNGFVYWQGLDSLAAPFVILNFNNEPQAFACFDKFIQKYLKTFFHRDNTVTVQEYLALFSHLIAFHDPSLFNHLDQLCFTPELYAIPWFLTMFTHVLPLDKIMHIWDTLLIGTETFPLCIGLAILIQLRDQLLNFSFNDCILIFSDLPEINIDNCLKEAVKLFCTTPSSIMQRQLFPLEVLRSQKSPVMAIEEFVALFAADSSKFFVIDTRSKEDKDVYGYIRDTYEDTCDIEINCPGQIVIVINSPIRADELIQKNVTRVCCVTIDGRIDSKLV